MSLNFMIFQLLAANLLAPESQSGVRIESRGEIMLTTSQSLMPEECFEDVTRALHKHKARDGRHVPNCMR